MNERHLIPAKLLGTEQFEAGLMAEEEAMSAGGADHEMLGGHGDDSLERENDRLSAEVERLTAENRRLLLLSLEDMKNAGTEVAIQAALDDIEDREQLRAEVDRLKEALDLAQGPLGKMAAELARLRPLVEAAVRYDDRVPRDDGSGVAMDLYDAIDNYLAVAGDDGRRFATQSGVTTGAARKDDMSPSREYLQAARAAVVAVAEKEGRKPDTELYDLMLGARQEQEPPDESSIEWGADFERDSTVPRRARQEQEESDG